MPRQSIKDFTFCALLLWLAPAMATSTTPPEDLSTADWKSIQRQIQAHAYTAEAQPEGGFRAHNPAHGLDIVHAPDGTTELRPRRGGDWHWRLTAQRVAGEALVHPTRLEQSGQTVTYHWNNNLREWWINRETGLEQWFELRQRPTGLSPKQPLTVEMAIQGNLHGVMAGEAIAFTDDTGAMVFTYDRLRVWDTTGRELAARMGVDGQTLTLTVADAGATYPLTIDPIVAVQGAYLKADNAGPSDQFGYSVAVDGDTVVVGAVGESNNVNTVNGDGGNNDASYAGAAYVFVRSGTSWTQQAYLKADNAEAGDQFGWRVAVDGDTVVVGAPREDSNARTVNGDGSSNDASNAGAAYVFVRSGTSWTQQAYLKVDSASSTDFFGNAVAVDGDTVVVGAPLEDTYATVDNAGAAYVFVRGGTTWTQQAYLKADNAGTDDGFGGSVAVDGDTVVVGAGGEDSNATTVNGDGSNNDAPDAGAAYVFIRSGTSWTQQAYLKANNAEADDGFGFPVAVDGDTVVVGAYQESPEGAAYVFVRNGTSWTQQAYLKANNAEAGDWFGVSVAVNGDTVVVGAMYEDSNATTVDGDGSNNDAATAGAAYIFVRNGTAWAQGAYLKADNAEIADQFGLSVAVDGDTVVVGAFFEDSNATTVNGDGNNNDAGLAGAAYVFDIQRLSIFSDGFESAAPAR